MLKIDRFKYKDKNVAIIDNKEIKIIGGFEYGGNLYCKFEDNKNETYLIDIIDLENKIFDRLPINWFFGIEEVENYNIR